MYTRLFREFRDVYQQKCGAHLCEYQVASVERPLFRSFLPRSKNSDANENENDFVNFTKDLNEIPSSDSSSELIFMFLP